MGKGTLRDSFTYAIRGILVAIASGRNMKIHIVAAIMAILTGWWLGINRLEWAIITISIFIVLAAETINTAIEKTVDLVTREYHPLAKQAKNLAAGAVLLAAVSAVIIGILIFGSYLF
ncbi:MAG TPA: diacylglycerol kinase family protein [Syntrophomonas sp.]|nr:diacylglycerol kinase family protein [Syntrophomonas sp.]HPT68899.1 diacylglycerol kinase family protein [Syntrophomonas sp.]